MLIKKCKHFSLHAMQTRNCLCIVNQCHMQMCRHFHYSESNSSYVKIGSVALINFVIYFSFKIVLRNIFFYDKKETYFHNVNITIRELYNKIHCGKYKQHESIYKERIFCRKNV